MAGFLDDNAQPLANKAIRRRPPMARARGNRASVIILERKLLRSSDRFPGRCPDLKIIEECTDENHGDSFACSIEYALLNP